MPSNHVSDACLSVVLPINGNITTQTSGYDLLLPVIITCSCRSTPLRSLDTIFKLRVAGKKEIAGCSPKQEVGMQA